VQFCNFRNIFRLGKACDDGTLIGCYFQGTMLYRQGTQSSQTQTTTSVLGKVFFIPLDAFCEEQKFDCVFNCSCTEY
jgi:hypothetical protein